VILGAISLETQNEEKGRTWVCITAGGDREATGSGEVYVDRVWDCSFCFRVSDDEEAYGCEPLEVTEQLGVLLYPCLEAFRGMNYGADFLIGWLSNVIRQCRGY
jgi:hypothetical protein